MDTAAEKGSMFGMDEGERLNVGRKNEFFEGKMGQTEGNVGCPESESIASERDRLRTMEMAGQLECGEKCGKTATVEAGLGKVGLKSDIWRETAKRHAARDRGNQPSGTRTGVQGVTPCCGCGCGGGAGGADADFARRGRSENQRGAAGGGTAGKTVWAVRRPGRRAHRSPEDRDGRAGTGEKK